MRHFLAMAAVAAAACGKGDGNQAAPPADNSKVAAKLDKIVAATKAADGAALGVPGDKLALDFDWDVSTKVPETWH